MDTMKYLKNQVEAAVARNKALVGLEDVLTHIERAERMLDIGNKDDEEHFYTDVIYRTNHAYEGILKEAYFVLASKNDKEITPNNIEKYLLDEHVLKERVVKLLENYRREWRNPSTHDYRLFFNSGEAFAAILSVTSFVHILLNQILDKLIYVAEAERIAPLIPDIKKNFDKNYYSLQFIEKIKFLLKNYDGNLYKEPNAHTVSLLTEREFLNGIFAYINAVDKNLNVELEPLIGDNLQPDMIISDSKGEKVLVELHVLKRTRNIEYKDYENQLVRYLAHGNMREGILFLIPRNINSDTVLEDIIKIFKVGTEELLIHIIHEKTK